MNTELPVQMYTFWFTLRKTFINKMERLRMPSGQKKRLKMQVEVTGASIPSVLVPGGLTGLLSWKPRALALSRSCLSLDARSDCRKFRVETIRTVRLAYPCARGGV